MPDTIKIEILADGTIRVETDEISGVNHLNAEQFLAEMEELAGGKTEVEQKTETVQHQIKKQQHLNQ